MVFFKMLKLYLSKVDANDISSRVNLAYVLYIGA